jgi:hypothetical protein
MAPHLQRGGVCVGGERGRAGCGLVRAGDVCWSVRGGGMRLRGGWGDRAGARAVLLLAAGLIGDKMVHELAGWGNKARLTSC